MPRPNRGPRLHWIDERGCFYILWYERGKKRVRSTRTADRREAEAQLANFIGRSHRASGPREPHEVAVAEALELYGGIHAPKTSDPARIGYAISALLPFWENNTLAQITPSACDRYAKERGVSQGTARRELGTLAAAVNFMVKDGRLTRPVPVHLPAKPASKDRWLTVSEAARLLGAARSMPKARSYLPLFILIGLYTGARKEAILSLRWPQVDLERRRINFALPGVAQTKKRRPLLPIPDRLFPFLEYAWKRRSSDLGPVLHIDGERIARIDKGFRTAVRTAGLEGVSPHTLRHTRGTWLAQAGVDLWQIAGWLGQDPATTERIYAHHHPDFMDAAKRATDRRR